MVDGSTRVNGRHAIGASGAAAGLALGVSHGRFTDRLSGHGFHSEA
jgi:hypothetical protein